MTEGSNSVLQLEKVSSLLHETTGLNKSGSLIIEKGGKFVNQLGEPKNILSDALTSYDKQGSWISRAGVPYIPNKKCSNRIKHILEHLRPTINQKKAAHSVFCTDEKYLLDLILSEFVLCYKAVSCYSREGGNLAQHKLGHRPGS